MNKKNILAILLVMVLVIFSGCSVGGDTKTSGIGIGGSDGASSQSGGVELEFAKGNPPNEMYIDSPVTFGFVFKNYQTHPITDLQIRVGGFDRGFVSGLNSEYSVSNIPKASDVGPGIYSGLVVDGVSVSGFSGDSFAFNPNFKYFYTAYTTYTNTVCVPDKTNQCDLNVDKKLVSNGPLKVSLTSIDNIGGKIITQFSITDSGIGRAINENSDINKEDYMVSYKNLEVKLGTNQGQCYPKGTDDFVLVNGKSNFYCEFTSSSDDAYISQLSVSFSYKYLQEKKLNLIVKNLAANR